MLTMDLNADLGEGAGVSADADLLRLVSSANIACGGHAGDRATIKTLLQMTAELGVAAGAHPAYEDQVNFGRVEVNLPPEEIAVVTGRQLELFAEVASDASLAVSHVKPHGALYHRVGTDPEAAAALVETVKGLTPAAALVGLPGSELSEAAAIAGVRFIPEGFADRGYGPDGSLIPRGSTGDELDPEEAAHQVLQLVGAVDPMPGVPHGRVQTICLHGDGPDPLAVAHAAREALAHAGYRLGVPASGGKDR
jgi:UPF0271 protein